MVRRSAPTGEFGIHWFAAGEDFTVVGHEVVAPGAVPIANADFNGLQRIQPIDVGHRQLINPVDHAGVARGDGNEP